MSALLDGHVECDECGHPIEDHSRKGCTLTECGCTDPWTKTEIRAARKREGLTATY